MRAGWVTAALLATALAWAWSQQSPQADAGATQAPVPAAGISHRSSNSTDFSEDRWPAFLPAEAHETLQRIERGGPFHHRQDGAVFQNRERRLPPQPRGYYREFTVETPGAGDRGPRRIVSGGDPPVEFFYTDDHYRSFRRFVAGATQ